MEFKKSSLVNNLRRSRYHVLQPGYIISHNVFASGYFMISYVKLKKGEATCDLYPNNL